MHIEDIRVVVAIDAIRWTGHVAQRLIKRNISPDEVLETSHFFPFCIDFLHKKT
jgi:hypothetical protein